MNETNIPAGFIPQPRKQLIGAGKAFADVLLENWTVIEDKLSTPEIRVFRYTQDVSLIICIRADKIVGVAVIDRPGAGVRGISASRFAELITMIGLEPEAADVVRDSRGICEFYVGDTNYGD